MLFPFTPTSGHADGLTSFVFILNLPLLSLLLSLQTEGCSLSSVFCRFRKPDGDSLWLVDQTSASFSLELCRACPVASTGRGNVSILFSGPRSESILERRRCLLTCCLASSSQLTLLLGRAFHLSCPSRCLRGPFPARSMGLPILPFSET